LAELANVGEALSGLAVLVSLVYLTVEVRKNTKTARSTASWNATVALGELCEGISHNAQLSALVVHGAGAESRPEDLSDDEFAQYFLFFRSVFFKYEAQWYLWKDGTLSDEMWENRRKWAKTFVSLPVPARVWQIEKDHHQYSAGFFESIDSATPSGDLSVSAIPK
jgi:hypothetical protein